MPLVPFQLFVKLLWRRLCRLSPKSGFVEPLLRLNEERDGRTGVGAIVTLRLRVPGAGLTISSPFDAACQRSRTA